MIDAAQRQIESGTIGERYLLSWTDVRQLVFEGESGLLQDQVAVVRRPAALARLQCYVGMAPGCTPIVNMAEARFEARMRGPDADRARGPSRPRAAVFRDGRVRRVTGALAVRLQQRQRRGLGALRRGRDGALRAAGRAADRAAVPPAARGARVSRSDAQPRPDHARAGHPRARRDAVRADGAAGDRPPHVPRAVHRRAFDDFVVDQGLLPPAQLEQAVATQFIPKYRPPAGA